MAHNQIKVSVIIPAYNEKKYIQRCLESIVKQSLKQIEIIIVDDGSTDGTSLICDEYKTRYSKRIKVIHKINEGVGLARNDGIAIAKGEYIGFIDADDWVESDMYLEMYEQAKKYDSEIVVCDIKKVYADSQKEKLEKSLPLPNGNIDLSEYLMHGRYPQLAWNKIYKREIWNTYKFKKMYFEDLDLILTIISNCIKISYVQKAFYNYFRRPNSISTSYSKIFYLDKMIAYKDAVFNVNPKYKEQVVFWIANNICDCMQRPCLVGFRAEFIELINVLSGLFVENIFIKNDLILSKLDNIKSQPLPKSIYIFNIGINKTNVQEEKNYMNWIEYTRNFVITELDNDSCNIEDAPIIVKRAYFNHQYDFVNDYFKIKTLYENGGITIDRGVKFKSPIGQMRAEKGFLFFKNQFEICTDIFGFEKNSKLLHELLDSYLINSNDNMLPLSKRFCNIAKKYGICFNNMRQSLTDGTTIYEYELLDRCFELIQN